MLRINSKRHLIFERWYFITNLTQERDKDVTFGWCGKEINDTGTLKCVLLVRQDEMVPVISTSYWKKALNKFTPGYGWIRITIPLIVTSQWSRWWDRLATETHRTRVKKIYKENENSTWTVIEIEGYWHRNKFANDECIDRDGLCVQIVKHIRWKTKTQVMVYD